MRRGVRGGAGAAVTGAAAARCGGAAAGALGHRHHKINNPTRIPRRCTRPGLHAAAALDTRTQKAVYSSPPHYHTRYRSDVLMGGEPGDRQQVTPLNVKFIFLGSVSSPRIGARPPKAGEFKTSKLNYHQKVLSTYSNSFRWRFSMGRARPAAGPRGAGRGRGGAVRRPSIYFNAKRPTDSLPARYMPACSHRRTEGSNINSDLMGSESDVALAHDSNESAHLEGRANVVVRLR
ncbi:hypothetical protein EVAR_59038_1 [Eumeta japonica]|uniref:Uncharacterized protein n=1 Tax=Eumeta variegata TaxID=151549 RepID=A0A4C1ZCR5_EUMVA|nr:hypothetical protein EVAR_59038_1 [Eumeta japonica]